MRGIESSNNLLKKKISRRKAISTAGKLAIGVIITGAVAGVAGYYAGMSAAPVRTVTKTVGTTVTTTKTVTATATPTPTKKAGKIKVYLEDVPEAHYISKLLDEFKDKTGIDAVFELAAYPVMHEKLISNFMLSKGAYDVIIVDNPWVAEFDEGGWLEPLDDFVEEHPELKIDDYLPSLLWTVGKYWKDGKLYMLPYYNYAVALMYRKDLIPKPPETWDEIYEIAKKLTKPPDFYGMAAQAKRGYKVVEEGLNYVYGAGGRVFDEKLNVVIDSPEAAKGLELYKKVLKDCAPPESIHWEFDEAFAFAHPGHAAMMITYNWMIGALNDPERSKTAGKWSVKALPGTCVLGAWGWAIPKNAPNKDLAYEFLAWVENPETCKKRALLGGAPTRTSVFKDPDLHAKYPYIDEQYKAVKNSLAIVPPILGGEEIVHVLGEEFSAAVTGLKPVEDALKSAKSRIEDVLKRHGYEPGKVHIPMPTG